MLGTRMRRDWEILFCLLGLYILYILPIGKGNGTPLQYSCLENPMDRGAWWAAVHGVAKSQTWLSDLTFTFHFHALEKEMATHSSVLAWRIPGTGEPGGLLSMGSHRVGHDWSSLAAAVYFWQMCLTSRVRYFFFCLLEEIKQNYVKQNKLCYHIKKCHHNFNHFLSCFSFNNLLLDTFILYFYLRFLKMSYW